MNSAGKHSVTFEDARKYFVFRQPVVRGGCLLAVVASHIPPLGVQWISFCVPVFVLLSGFYLSLSPRNEHALSFYRRTLKFLLIPYMLYSIVYAIPRAMRGATPSELWQGFLASELEAHLWYMPMIIGLYLLHPWLRRLYRESPPGICFAAFALQLWGWPLAKANGMPEGAITTLLSCTAMLGYFVAGYFILDHAKAAWWLCEHWAGRVACAVIWLFYPILNRWLATHDVGWPIRAVPAAASVAAAFFVLTSVSRPKSRVGQSIAGWGAAFGLYSFGVYLIHPLVISVVSRGVTRLTGLTSGEPLWGFSVFALTAPAALGIVKWLANRPLGRYFT